MRSVLVFVALVACNDAPGSAGCFGVCGEGTVCKAGMCVVAEADAKAEAAIAADDVDPKTGKRRRGGKRSAGEAIAAAEGEGEAFTPVDDSDVAEFDVNKTQVVDMKAGTERLDDELVRAHLRRLEPQFNGCIETAAEQSEEELRGGDVDFVFGIAPSGRVDGVTVKAPAHLRVFGIVPCLRKVLAGHRFPKFDGPAMGVDYSFDVG